MKDLKQRTLNALRFLLFLEENPTHRVTESIPILGLALLSLLTFALGIYGFVLLSIHALLAAAYGVCIMFVPLEVLHFIYDRR